MKSTFLVASATSVAGQTKVILKDVNGGDGLNEFRAGSQKGDVVFDFYGDQPTPEPGKTYVLTLEEYVEPAETNDNSETTTDAPTEKAPTSPLSIAFNAMVTIAIDENGKPTLNIEASHEDAPAKETEETTDTQDQGSISTDTAADQTDFTDAGSADADNISQKTSSDVQSDTNTQDNAGPAAGANDSEAGNSDAANPDNLANKGTGPVGEQSQVS